MFAFVCVAFDADDTFGAAGGLLEAGSAIESSFARNSGSRLVPVDDFRLVQPSHSSDEGGSTSGSIR